MKKISTILYFSGHGVYMAKLDNNDAYYSIPIPGEHQKVLKFKHKTTLYKFTLIKFIALPHGYTERPRKFTKTLKPALATIRKEKIAVAGFFDDLITLAKTEQACFTNISTMVKMFVSLGFVMHPRTSTFKTTQVIEFLGFIIDSRNMTSL